MCGTNGQAGNGGMVRIGLARGQLGHCGAAHSDSLAGWGVLRVAHAHGVSAPPARLSIGRSVAKAPLQNARQLRQVLLLEGIIVLPLSMTRTPDMVSVSHR